MTRGETIGVLLALFGALLIVPELFTPRPVGAAICAGLLLIVGGGLLVCDYPHESRGGRDRGH